jgi:hypothetical protein
MAWILATVIGFALGGYLFHLPGSFGGLPAWDSVAVIFGAGIGFVTGIAVGLLQWVTLRLPRQLGARLVVAMALGFGVTHGLMDGAPDSIGLLLVSAGSGVAVALLFAALLGQRASMVMLVSAVGWGGGIWFAAWWIPRLGLPFHETPHDWALAHLAQGLVMAIAWAVPTALVGLPAALRAQHDRPAQAMSLA